MTEDLLLVHQTWGSDSENTRYEIFEQINPRAFLLLIPLPVRKS